MSSKNSYPLRRSLIAAGIVAGSIAPLACAAEQPGQTMTSAESAELTTTAKSVAIAALDRYVVISAPEACQNTGETFNSCRATGTPNTGLLYQKYVTDSSDTPIRTNDSMQFFVQPQKGDSSTTEISVSASDSVYYIDASGKLDTSENSYGDVVMLTFETPSTGAFDASTPEAIKGAINDPATSLSKISVSSIAKHLGINVYVDGLNIERQDASYSPKPDGSAGIVPPVLHDVLPMVTEQINEIGS